MTENEFRAAIVEILHDMNIREIARVLRLPVPTVARWVLGDAAPVPSLRPHAIAKLKEIK